MRKLTPYDDVICFCKEPMQITQREGGGQSTTAAQSCRCVAVPSKELPLRLRTRAQYEASLRARKLKLTQFNVRGVLVTPTKVTTRVLSLIHI